MNQEQNRKIVCNIFFALFLVCLMQVSSIGKCGDRVIVWEDLFSSGDAIFEGKVIRIKDTQEDRFVKEVRFQVKKVWKGKIEEETIILYAPFPCGIKFNENKRYIVIANKIEIDDPSTSFDERKWLHPNLCNSSETTNEVIYAFDQLNKNAITYPKIIAVVRDDNALYLSQQNDSKLTAVLIILLYLGIGVFHSWIRYRKF